MIDIGRKFPRRLTIRLLDDALPAIAGRRSSATNRDKPSLLATMIWEARAESLVRQAALPDRPSETNSGNVFGQVRKWAKMLRADSAGSHHVALRRYRLLRI